MPKVGKMSFPYDKAGKKDAKAMSKKMGMPMNMKTTKMPMKMKKGKA